MLLSTKHAVKHTHVYDYLTKHVYIIVNETVYRKGACMEQSSDATLVDEGCGQPICFEQSCMQRCDVDDRSTHDGTS